MNTSPATVRLAALRVLEEAERTNDFRELPHQLRLVLRDTDPALSADRQVAELFQLLSQWERSPRPAEWLAFRVAMALMR